MTVKVPDRAKVKGAGTAAIVDLVGFREDNVLPVAAFYGRGDTTVNYLAEVGWFFYTEKIAMSFGLFRKRSFLCVSTSVAFHNCNKTTFTKMCGKCTPIKSTNSFDLPTLP